MPRPPSPEVRSLLIERAAAMLAHRDPVTLRSLIAGTGVSTMALYTYFDGMPGLWRAVREEGFRRLTTRIETVAPSRDPVRYLAALGVAYVDNAVANPDLYRVMFDATYPLDDPEVADRPFAHLVEAAHRAVAAQRFDPTNDPADIALRFWAAGHGIISLHVTGVLPLPDLGRHAPAMVIAQFVDAGDTPEAARRSVTAAWRSWPTTAPQPEA